MDGATVNLYDEDGHLVATTTTNDRGEYYFDSRTTPGLKTNAKYTVKMDNPADYTGSGPLAGWKLSPTTTGDDGNPASVGEGGYPQIKLTTGDHGEDAHEYDFGFTKVVTPPTPPAVAPAEVQQEPALKITKRDKATRREADTKSAAIRFKRGQTRTISMPAKNTGAVPLHDVVISEKTLSGPGVKDFRCRFPDGKVVKGRKGVVKWSASFGSNPKVWNPGVTIPCTATLTMKAGSKVHHDTVRVTARSPQGRLLSDSDPFWATVPVGVPHTGA